MRKLITEKSGIEGAQFMTYEQLLVLIAYECGEHAIEDFLKSRYEFPILHDEYEKEKPDEPKA